MSMSQTSPVNKLSAADSLPVRISRWQMSSNKNANAVKCLTLLNRRRLGSTISFTGSIQRSLSVVESGNELTGNNSVNLVSLMYYVMSVTRTTNLSGTSLWRDPPEAQNSCTTWIAGFSQFQLMSVLSGEQLDTKMLLSSMRRV